MRMAHGHGGGLKQQQLPQQHWAAGAWQQCCTPNTRRPLRTDRHLKPWHTRVTGLAMRLVGRCAGALATFTQQLLDQLCVAGLDSTICSDVHDIGVNTGCGHPTGSCRRRGERRGSAWNERWDSQSLFAGSVFLSDGDGRAPSPEPRARAPAPAAEWNIRCSARGDARIFRPCSCFCRRECHLPEPPAARSQWAFGLERLPISARAEVGNFYI